MGRRLVAVLGIALAMSIAGSALGAPFDHLACYRLKADGERWVVNEHARQPLVVFPSTSELHVEEGCELVPRGAPRPREICVPADKAPREGLLGEDLGNGFLCYNMRCTEQPSVETLVFGQFGSGRPLAERRRMARRLCVPAGQCHDVCRTGLALHRSCGGCAEAVCAVDFRCCTTGWDQQCVLLAADVCAASCEPLGCSRATVVVDVNFEEDGVLGVELDLEYPAAKVTMPGTGSQAEVTERVQNLTGINGGLFGAADFDQSVPPFVKAALVSPGIEIQSGALISVTFECVGGAPPLGEDFPCRSTAGDILGHDVGSSCTVAAISLTP
ncbi:MAG: hypothetical protein AB1689_29470 [Thermodesulfobacteriota bacterium]